MGEVIVRGTELTQTKTVRYKGYEICMGSVYKDGEPLFHYYVPLGEGDGGVEQGKRIIDQIGSDDD
ncbi:hypothetical protein IP92_05440 [Pseudoduganella flava]|jgi:hypothetical protein|uniref:Uncharacterized protein n=1 Tax=Pseudoduganella flava TaxID=871742 RepID=A0A562PDF8_9BURK|nr:hypothetical protein IP92_05440 [Pseudoduganella flava]